jgi:trehalose monomycolate/heme transporter
MFASWGQFTYRRRRLMLAVSVALLAFCGIWGTGVFGELSAGGFEDPKSESSRATAQIAKSLGRDAGDVIAIYRSADLTVDDPAFRTSITTALSALPRDAVISTTTYWATNSPALISQDRKATYVLLQLAGADEGARQDTYAKISGSLNAPGLTLLRGGVIPITTDINTQITKDLAQAEKLSLPLVLLGLVIVFGGLLAAGLPLGVGIVAILGAFTALRLLTLFTNVSVFSINIVTMLGLGLAIDYALFMVSRFREESRRQPSVEQAVVATMTTAGRTVLFSGFTVGVSLGALLLFPQPFLRSMGFGGMAAVMVAMVASLTVLPATLAVLGPRVDALRIRIPSRLRRRPAMSVVNDTSSGAWAMIARLVMRRPVIVAVTVLAGLMLLGAPFLRVHFGGSDARILPVGAEGRVAAETLDRDFPASDTLPIEVIANGISRPDAENYLRQIRAVPGVTRAEVARSSGSAVLIAASHRGTTTSSEAQAVVTSIRQVPIPLGAQVLVGGETARLVDLLASLGKTLPWAGVMVLAITVLLLFFAFGSVVLPIKAVAINVLSLSAAFGVVVWIFQDGHGAGILGFTSTGTIEATQPILMLAMIFGLSMDYEVFLLSRIREEWDETGDNTHAVAVGLQRSGRIITSAAALFAVVIGAFATSGITIIKMVGIGVFVAILLDATVVRALLVPATMRLLGRANWWAPAALIRVYRRFGFRDGDSPSAVSGVEPVRGTTPIRETMRG